jgi:hypothetical protein
MKSNSTALLTGFIGKRTYCLSSVFEEESMTLKRPHLLDQQDTVRELNTSKVFLGFKDIKIACCQDLIVYK